LAEALEIHQRQGRCERLESPQGEKDHVLATWGLKMALGQNLLQFRIFLEPSLNMTVRGGFGGPIVEEMTLRQKLECVNVWNRKKKWTKYFVEEDGDISLEYDLDLAKLSEPRAPAIREAVLLFERSLAQAAMELHRPELRELMMAPEMDEFMRKLKSVVERRSSM